MAKGLLSILHKKDLHLNHEDKPYIFYPFVVEKVCSWSGRVPRARSGHRIVSHNGNLFCFGGYNPDASQAPEPPIPGTWSDSNPLFKELWSFCFARRTWRLLPVQETIPEELASNAVTLEGRTLMIYGGTGTPFGHHCSNSLYTYHVSGENGGLQLMATRGEKPSPQYGQAIVCHDGYLYTIGGTNGYDYTCDVHRLNLRTATWETVYTCCGNRSNEPAGRYRHEVAFDGKDIYVLAGGTAEWAFDFASIPIFNIETLTWRFEQSKPDPRFRQSGLPRPRMCHSAVQIKNSENVHVFIIGGTGDETIYSDIWRLEIPTLQWTLMTKSILPEKVHFHSSTITPAGCVYTFGGVRLKEDMYVRVNTMYKVWVCIPKLSEMCWESILHTFPKIVNADRSKLLLAGIPLDFVERLQP